jgi:putative adenylate-forming enzyme
VIDSLAILAQYLYVRYGRRFHSRQALERHQRRAFDRLARRHLVRSPVYQSYVGRPLDAYPRSDKAAMLDGFDRINTRGLNRDRLIELALRAEATRDFSPMLGGMAVGLSSGTSGRRSLFVTSRRERQLYIGGVLARALPGSIFARHRVGLLLRANNRLYTAVESGRISFAFFDLLAPFASLLDEMQVYQPDVLIGPPQALRLVAEAQRLGRVRLGPRKIVAGAEILEPGDAAAIEEVFGVRVDQIYQAAEGFLGITCERGTLHLNEDAVVFERDWIDRAARCFVPIVTDLARSTQPVVRYRLDDVLVERAEACACGSVFTAIERIRGRADDILFLPSRDGPGSDNDPRSDRDPSGVNGPGGDNDPGSDTDPSEGDDRDSGDDPRGGEYRLVPVMPDFVRDALALQQPVLSDYRVVQVSPTSIVLHVAGPDPVAARAAATRALATVFARHAVRQPTLQPGGPIHQDLTTKLRRVERRFKLPVE